VHCEEVEKPGIAQAATASGSGVAFNPSPSRGFFSFLSSSTDRFMYSTEQQRDACLHSWNMDHRFMSAANFNRISTFEDQSPKISDTHLRNIASIYARHGVKNYEAGYLHRHYDLPDDHIMAHVLREGKDFCKAYPLNALDHDRLSPHSFCLNQDAEFQAYEYVIDAAPRNPLPPKFLHDLKDYLLENQLEHVVSVVSPDTNKSGMAFETLDPEQSALWSSPASIRQGSSFPDGVTTSWRFTWDLNDLNIHETKRCVFRPTGLHDKVPDSTHKTASY
jgi:hypothetical protein